MSETLEAGNVGLWYGNRRILRGVSISVAPGEIVAVIGPNGAGKSTLLKSMAGLLSPSSGGVRLRGRPIVQIDRATLCRDIAYLPQERAVHWPLTVRSLVALGRLPHQRWKTAPAGEDLRAVDDAMHAMDIRHLADRPASELSGGERARVLLARALAQQARFLIADEPSTGLDPAHGLTLFAQFVRLAAEKRGIIVALHDLSLAARYCDRVLLLQCGVALAEGKPTDVLTPDRLAEGFGVRALVGQLSGWPIVLPVEPLSETDQVQEKVRTAVSLA